MAEPLTFSIGADGDVTVRSYSELKRWLQKERSRWAWLVPGDGRTDRYSFASSLQNTWTRLVSEVEEAEARGDPLEDVKSDLELLSSGPLLVSSTTIGATVLDIKEAVGDMPASFAAGFLKRHHTVQNAQTQDDLLGMILSVFPSMADPADWTERLKRERTNFRMATRSLLEKVDAEAAERDKAARELSNRARGIARRIFDLRRRTWRATQTEWELSAGESVAQVESRALNAVTSITNAEASYREFMRLKAPVEYWDNKAKEHSMREASARKRLYWYFPVTIVILAVVFVASGWFLLSHPDTQSSKAPIALYVVVSGGLLLLSTLAFWIGRLLTKLYLSEHHLRNDAEERATMTTTYLALTGENAAGETDRQIILNALFRATPDGIVKEDGPGDIGLQGLLAKLMAK